jgi:hypothetical protein
MSNNSNKKNKKKNSIKIDSLLNNDQELNDELTSGEQPDEQISNVIQELAEQQYVTHKNNRQFAKLTNAQATRLEAERQEAEILEAARQEADRQEAERQEAARQELLNKSNASIKLRTALLRNRK